LELHSRNDIEKAFTTIKKQNHDAFIIFGSGITFEHRKFLADQLLSTRRPAMWPHIAFVASGGLMSYGPDFSHLYRRAAVYVDKILKGSKPAVLPVEQPKEFELVINLKTAKQIGVTIPSNILARAHKVLK
jgi:putative tryptophan/tyrosine transport system substrate-binding protein